MDVVGASIHPIVGVVCRGDRSDVFGDSERPEGYSTRCGLVIVMKQKRTLPLVEPHPTGRRMEPWRAVRCGLSVDNSLCPSSTSSRTLPSSIRLKFRYWRMEMCAQVGVHPSFHSLAPGTNPLDKLPKLNSRREYPIFRCCNVARTVSTPPTTVTCNIPFSRQEFQRLDT